MSFGVALEGLKRTQAILSLLLQNKQAVHDMAENTFGIVEEFPCNPGLIGSEGFKLGRITNYGKHPENADILLFDAIADFAPLNMLDAQLTEVGNLFPCAFALSSAVITAPLHVLFHYAMATTAQVVRQSDQAEY